MENQTNETFQKQLFSMLKEQDNLYESLKDKHSIIQEEKQVFETAIKEIAEFEHLLEQKAE